jgi:polyferredoxin
LRDAVVSYQNLAKLRRLSQIAFFIFFCLLLLRTEFRGALRASGSDVRLDYPVRFFFELDPLAALANALASHTLYRGLLWALVIVVPTLFLGRFFCGWICPMGALHHFVGSLKSASKLGKQRVESNRYKRWQTTKYYVLVALLVAAALGTAVVGWLDPFSVLVRSVGLSIFPAVNYALNAFVQALEHSDFTALRAAGGALHAGLAATVLDFRQPYFRQGIYLGLIFLILLALNLRVTRFWCRALCPLGALLGITARWSILGLRKNAEACNDCNRCLMQCQGGDEPQGHVPWHKAECVLCLNCVTSCPKQSLAFAFFDESKAVAGPNLQRRKALAGVVAGVAALPLLRSTTGYAVGANERLLRPPGALDEASFLERCLRCGECMKVCPNNALQPAVSEAGLEGLWTPVLVPHIGYCEPSCVLCSQVCPTGAIWEITPREKGWVVGETTQPIRLGTAFYDRGRCLPWAMGIECIVCQEWCPTSPKAIVLHEAEVIDAAGNRKVLKQPAIDPAQCIGCGSCEHACVLTDRPAVYVTSIGESRALGNQLLLHRTQGKA